MMKKTTLVDFLWDAWCLCSVIGIWPRFIEPKLLTTTRVTLRYPRLPKSLKVAHFSDLHLGPRVSDAFLRRLAKRVNSFRADLIVFTGDFLPQAKLHDESRLQKFLCSLQARVGCFAVLGNNDYSQHICINQHGDYDVKHRDKSGVAVALQRLVVGPKPTGHLTPEAEAVKKHEALCRVLKETPFRLLHNETVRVNVDGVFINICGLGDYMAGQCKPAQAFMGYQKDLFGMVLSHNPDSIPDLMQHPGDLVLCGHTHGGGVHIPGLQQRLTVLECPQYIHGHFPLRMKHLFVTRGVGASLPLRCFSPPEVVLLELSAQEPSGA